MKIFVGKAMLICVKSWGRPELLIINRNSSGMCLFVNALVDVAPFGIANLLRSVVRVISQAIGINLWIDDLGRPDALN